MFIILYIVINVTSHAAPAPTGEVRKADAASLMRVLREPRRAIREPPPYAARPSKRVLHVIYADFGPVGEDANHVEP